MAEKRYFFLKLPEDFFQSLKIKKLRRIAGGDTYTIIYLKMQLLSLKNGGYLTYEGVEDDLADELALMLDESSEDIKMTLAFLTANGLIEQSTENPDSFLLPEAAASFIREGSSASRMRKLRERQKKELPEPEEASHCDEPVTDMRHTSVTVPEHRYGELEKELELEKEKEKKKKGAPAGASSSRLDKKETEARKVIAEYTENVDLQEALGQFLTMRKDIKKPMSGKSMKMLTTKLDNLASSDAEKIAMLEESVINGWQSVWPLKNQPAQPKKAVPDCLNWGKEGNLH